MRLLLIIFIILVAIANTALAQYNGVGISVNGGVSYISLTLPVDNVKQQSDPLFCFETGMFYKYNPTKHSGIEAELNYLLQQGRITDFVSYTTANGDTTINTGTDVITTKLGYLSLPLRYVYSIHHFAISGGAQLGWALHQRAFNTGYVFTTDSVISFSSEYEKPIVKNFDLGFTLGAAHDISSNFFVCLHAYHSILNIVANKDNWGVRRNTNIVAGIGYRFLKAGKKS